MRPITTVILFGLILRILHLFPGDHYPVLGADSYYFLSLSQKIDAGQAVAPEQSGLAYPIAWLASITTIEISFTIIPLIIYVITALLLYRFVSILFDRRWGLAAMVAYTIMPLSILTTAAGFIDRDGFTVCLMILAVMGWMVLIRWPGMVLVWFIVMAELMAYYWCGLARWTYIAIVLSMAAVSYWQTRKRSILWILAAVAVVMSIGIADQALDQIAHTSNTVADSLSGVEPIIEMSPATPAHLAVFLSITLLFLLVGIFVMIQRSSAVDFAILTWLAGTMITGIVLQRILILAIPPMSITAGAGMVTIYDWVARILKDHPPARVKATAGALIVIALTIIICQSYWLGSADRIAPDRDWQAALDYLKYRTDPKATVLSHWGSGRWIEVLADRDAAAAGSPKNIAEMDIICKAWNGDNVYYVMEKCESDYLILDIDRTEFPGMFENEAVYQSGDIVVLSYNPAHKAAESAN